MPERVYLDWNATAPLRPEARAAMIAAMDVVGNPSSVHAEGRAAKAIVERAREQVAALVGCDPDEVVFTSGATEAANSIIFLESDVFCSAVEHDSVYEAINREMTMLRGSGMPCDSNGIFDSSSAYSTDLAVQLANGETGVIQSLSRGLYFVDATQAAGKIKFGFGELGAHLGTVSGHKFGAPKGIGILYASFRTQNLKFLNIPPLIVGGGQERGRRAGTENVIGIAGFGAAAEAARRDLEAGVWDGLAALRDNLEAALRDCAGDEMIIFGESAPRLPNTSCFAVPGWKGSTQVMQLDLAGFAVSAGSACSSGKVGPSRVLLAMGHDELTASSAIRVSIGPTTTEQDIARFVDSWTALYRRRKQRAA